MVESELGFQFLILLFDRPALMRQLDRLLDGRGRRQVDEEVCRSWCRAEILFAQEPDLGASRRSRHSLAGVTRLAAKRAAQGRLAPLRHVMRRHARGGNVRAKALRAIGRVSSTKTTCDRGRPVRGLGGTCTAGVPGNTVRRREAPTAYARLR